MPAARQHTAFGHTTTLAGHAVKAGVSVGTLRSRMDKGRTLEEAMLLKVRSDPTDKHVAQMIESQLIAIQNMRWTAKHRRRLAALEAPAS